MQRCAINKIYTRVSGLISLRLIVREQGVKFSLWRRTNLRYAQPNPRELATSRAANLVKRTHRFTVVLFQKTVSFLTEVFPQLLPVTEAKDSCFQK